MNGGGDAEKMVRWKMASSVHKYVRFCKRGGGIPVHGGVFSYFVEQNFSQQKQKSKNQNEHSQR